MAALGFVDVCCDVPMADLQVSHAETIIVPEETYTPTDVEVRLAADAKMQFWNGKS